MNNALDTRIAAGRQELGIQMSRLQAWQSHSLEWVDRTGSTNEDLKADWASNSCPMRFRIAGYQAAGRGQRGRTWTSASGAGLLFSFTWTWRNIDTAWEIPIRTGLATRTALLPFVGPDHRLWLKWPNDICLDDGKLGGILVESTLREDALALVIGIGINLHLPGALIDQEAGPGMQPAALDACGTSERTCDRSRILQEFVAAWADQVSGAALSGHSALRTAYIKAAGPFWGRSVRILRGDGETVEGCAETISADGALEISEKNGGHQLIRDARRVMLAD